MTGLIVLLFRQFLLGRAVFIGNPDRLNTYLNMLRFHVDGIRAGHLNAWNESLFGGMNSFGLAYTFPNPLTYLLSLAPPAQLFAAANLVSFALLAAAGWASYAFIRSICGSPRHAFVGAALYELCFLAVLRASQNDMTSAVLLVIPLMLLAVRRAQPGNERWPFVGLTLLLAGLMFLTFLQEAAYAVLLGGAYALYRSRSLSSRAPLRVFAAAFLVGTLAAAPRLYTVQQELALTVRSTSAPWNWPPLIDGLRFFSDAMFGRTQLESRALANGVSHSEGMLLFVSCFAPLLLAAGILRYRGEWFHVPARGSGEAGFFLWAVLGCLAIVYVTPLYHLFHLLFLRANFIHARFLIVALLPLCALIAFLLRDLESNANQGRRVSFLVGLLAGSFIAGVIQLLAQADDPHRKVFLGQSPAYLLADCLRTLAYQPPEPASLPDPPPVWNYHCGHLYLAAFALRQIFWSAVVFAAIGLLRLRWRNLADPRSGLAACLGGLMIGQTFLAADYRVNGPHTARATRSRNVDTDDLQRASPEQFGVPSEAAVTAFAQRLETNRYHTVVLAPPQGWGIAAPYLGPFWRLRQMEGYGSAIPTRVYALPFPATTIHGCRGLGYHQPDELDWRFLAFANVKYVVTANQVLYRNAAPLLEGGWREAAPSDVAIMENPFPVVPRVFFTRRVRTVGSPRAAVLTLFGGHVFKIRGDLDPLLPGPEEWDDSARDMPDPQAESVVEGNLAEQEFAADGRISARFAGDRIAVEVEAAERPRFLVLSELYHPGWSATVDGRATPIYPTNVYMRGLVVPPGATRVTLRFRPWVSSPAAWGVYLLALILLVGGGVYLRRAEEPLAA